MACRLQLFVSVTLLVAAFEEVSAGALPDKSVHDEAKENSKAQLQSPSPTPAELTVPTQSPAQHSSLSSSVSENRAKTSATDSGEASARAKDSQAGGHRRADPQAPPPSPAIASNLKQSLTQLSPTPSSVPEARAKASASDHSPADSSKALARMESQAQAGHHQSPVLQVPSPILASGLDPIRPDPIQLYPTPSPNPGSLAKPSVRNSNNKVPTHFRYKTTASNICSGKAYTDNQATGCNGWAGLSQEQCQQKCSHNAKALNCPQQACLAAVFFPSNGWCHLYAPSECEEQHSLGNAVTFVKVKQGIFNNPVVDQVKETMNPVVDEVKKSMNPVVDKVKKTMHDPLTHEILGAGGIAVGIGVAAAGVEAALQTRDQTKPTLQPALPPSPQIAANSYLATSTSTTLALHRASASLAASQPSSARPQGAQALPSRLVSPPRPGTSSPTTTSVIAAGGVGLPISSRIDLFLWLPLVILCCCCFAAALTGLACKSKINPRGLDGKYSAVSASEDEEEMYSDDYDVEDGLE